MMTNEELHPLTVAREARNLSQAQLAEEVKLGPRTIWAAEHQRPISAHSRRQLCRYFKKTAQELGLVSAESAARGRKRQKRVLQIPVASVNGVSPALLIC
jgi:transcriptional regulator with XRE-family HTH domain